MTKEQIEEWREMLIDPQPWASEKQRVAAINALCDAALSASSQERGWIPCGERLPELEQTVLVSFASGYDGKPVYAWGARVDDSDGWLWGISSGTMGIRPDKDAGWNDINADDDYVVTHWQPLPPPPMPLETK